MTKKITYSVLFGLGLLSIIISSQFSIGTTGLQLTDNTLFSMTDELNSVSVDNIDLNCHNRVNCSFIFGPETVERTTGQPDEFYYNFNATPGIYTMYIRNRNVSSAWLELNGEEVASPDDFNQNIPGLKIPVTINAENTLYIKLASQPGSNLTIAIGSCSTIRCVPVGIIGVRWGNIDRNATFTGMIPWDGYISVSDGVLRLIKPLLFERGGNYSRGGDDYVYPQTDTKKIVFRSSTTTHWDGLLIAYIPKNVSRTGFANVTITIHTQQYSITMPLVDLLGKVMIEQIDNAGHKIQFGADLKIICKKKSNVTTDNII